MHISTSWTVTRDETFELHVYRVKLTAYGAVNIAQVPQVDQYIVYMAAIDF